MRCSKTFIIAILSLLIPISLLLSISVGMIRVSVIDIFLELFKDTDTLDINSQSVIWEIRFPRACMAVIAGATLAIAGAALQSALRNPLVSPFTMGISSGASFGAALAIILGIGLGGVGAYLVMLNAFVFALLAGITPVIIARFKGVSVQSVILAGIAIMYIFSAGITLLQYIAREWQLTELVYWIMGDLGKADWRRLTLIFPAFIFCVPLFKYAWDFNVLMMGEEVAKSLGTDPRRVRVACIILSTLSTAIVVCLTGPIGFIGLVSPHIARFLLGVDNRFSMIGSALVGALLLLISDTIARTVLGPIEIPVGVVTAFLGVPFFVSLLVKVRKEIW